MHIRKLYTSLSVSALMLTSFFMMNSSYAMESLMNNDEDKFDLPTTKRTRYSSPSVHLEEDRAHSRSPSNPEDDDDDIEIEGITDALSSREDSSEDEELMGDGYSTFTDTDEEDGSVADDESPSDDSQKAP